MRRWPFVLLFAIPLLDVVLLVYVATVIGGVATVALVVLTALIGLLLVRAEGRYTLGRLQRKLSRGEVPAAELMDGGLLLVAGAFLLTPGLVTDVVGLLLVLPPTRLPIRVALSRWVVMPMLEERTGGLLSGDVYTFTDFPGESGLGFVGGSGWPSAGGDGPGRPRSAGREPGEPSSDGGTRDDSVDLGSDAYRVEVEDAEDADRDVEDADGDVRDAEDDSRDAGGDERDAGERNP